MSLLAINKLYYSSEEGKTVLENISLSVGSGEIVILVGKSGAGKTLLLEIIYGTAAPLTGDVIFKGVAVSDLKLKKNLSLGRSIAYLPKTGILFHDRTVEENIEFYLSLNSFVKKDKSGKVLPFQIRAAGPPGRELVKVIATEDSLALSCLGLGKVGAAGTRAIDAGGEFVRQLARDLSVEALPETTATSAKAGNWATDYLIVETTP